MFRVRRTQSRRQRMSTFFKLGQEQLHHLAGAQVIQMGIVTYAEGVIGVGIGGYVHKTHDGILVTKCLEIVTRQGIHIDKFNPGFICNFDTKRRVNVGFGYIPPVIEIAPCDRCQQNGFGTVLPGFFDKTGEVRLVLRRRDIAVRLLFGLVISASPRYDQSNPTGS